MKKIFLTGLLLAVMLPMMGASVMAAEYRLYQVQFCDERLEPRTDLSYVKVFNAGSLTASTLKAERSGDTAVANPMIRTSSNTGLRPNNGLAQFYSTKTTVDIIAHVGGREVSFRGVKPTDKYFVVSYLSIAGGLRPKGAFDTFQCQPISVGKIGVGAAVGAAGSENLMHTGCNIFEYHIIGTATVLSPTRIATGLSIGLDVADNDGIEICPGILAGNGSAFVVGTDGPFHFRCTFDIADVSGSDNVMVGFRKAEAYQATALDDYDEMAAFDVVSGDIKTATVINAATTVVTDTTNNWADLATHVLEVDVALNGAVTYKIDGVAPGTTVAYSFDAGEVVVPFFFNRYDATTPGVIYIIEWDCALDD